MKLEDYFIINENILLDEEQQNEIIESNKEAIDELKSFFLSKQYENLDEDLYRSLEKNFNKLFVESKNYNTIVNLSSQIKLTNEYSLNVESLLEESQNLNKRFSNGIYESALFNFLCIMESNKEDINFITEDSQIYDALIKQLQEAKENNVPIDEGLFKSVLGGLTGATFGPMVSKAFCKALGIDERGTLGNLLTSRLVCGAVAAYVGYKN